MSDLACQNVISDIPSQEHVVILFQHLLHLGLASTEGSFCMVESFDD